MNLKIKRCRTRFSCTYQALLGYLCIKRTIVYLQQKCLLTVEFLMSYIMG